MKKLIFISLIFVLISCKQESLFVLDPAAMIKITAENSPRKVISDSIVSNPQHLTPLEIVKLANNMRGFNAALNATTGEGASIGFAGKDTVSENPALLRYGTDIIDTWGNLVPDLIEGYDFAIEIFRANDDIDTIAYIPNIYIREAEAIVKKAYAEKDYKTVYEVFHDAFKFIPITGAEYRALKEKGLQ